MSCAGWTTRRCVADALRLVRPRAPRSPAALSPPPPCRGGRGRGGRVSSSAAAADHPGDADDPSSPPSRRNVVDVLKERGLLDGVTDEAGLRRAAASGRLKAYCGFDPTADSLHLGNLLGVVVLSWFQRCGHTPVALVGGATGRVGDPSGKSTERPVLGDDALAANVAGVAEVLTRLLGRRGPASPAASAETPLPAVELLNNVDWLGAVSLLDFLRDTGKFARVGVMLAKDSVKSRLAGDGLSFTEFAYQLLQAADFAYLARERGVAVQVGGADQWGNITAGVDLLRRTGWEGPAFGLTFPLLLKSDGSKFGKSESGALWLSADKLSPYKLYQHLYATPDADVDVFLRRLTFLPRRELEAASAAAAAPGAPPCERQRLLAASVVAFVHGEEGLDAALRATAALAPGASASDAPLSPDALRALMDDSDVPRVALPFAQVASGSFSIAELAVASGLQPSKGAARRLIKGGGVYLNNVKVTEEAATVAPPDAASGPLLLACGKKNKVLITLTD